MRGYESKKEGEMKEVEYLTCGCRKEVMRIEYIKDDDLKEFSTDMVQIAIYRQRQSDWGYRLQLIWHILVHGEPYGDDIILGDNEVFKLRTILREIQDN
jgi:hypothetical protein